MSINIGVMI